MQTDRSHAQLEDARSLVLYQEIRRGGRRGDGRGDGEGRCGDKEGRCGGEMKRETRGEGRKSLPGDGRVAGQNKQTHVDTSSSSSSQSSQSASSSGSISEPLSVYLNSLKSDSFAGFIKRRIEERNNKGENDGTKIKQRTISNADTLCLRECRPDNA